MCSRGQYQNPSVALFMSIYMPDGASEMAIKSEPLKPVVLPYPALCA